MNTSFEGESFEQVRAGWRRLGYHPGISMGTALARAGIQFPDSRFDWVSDTRPFHCTLAQLRRASLALASGLMRLGLRPGDVLAYQMPNWYEGAVTLHAALSAGLTVLPIVHFCGPAERSAILRDARARALVTARSWGRRDYVSELADGVEPVEHVIVLDGGGTRYRNWQSLLSDDSANLPEHERPVDQTCALIYTSGSSAAPKGVRHHHDSLFASARTYREFGPPGTVMLNPSPPGHISNLGTLVCGMAFGRSLIFVDKWDARRAIDICNHYRPGVMVGSAAFFTLMREEEQRLGAAASAWPSTFCAGGMAVPPSLIRDMDSTGRVGVRVYGSSEMPSVTSGRLSDPVDVRAETDGLPSPGTQIAILDDSGHAVSQGRRGEVAIRAPQMFQGYLNQPFPGTDGWFLTGDIGHLNVAGYLVIDGRKKDIIIRGGENISAREVENVLSSHPAVAEAVAFSLPDRRLGEAVCVAVRLNPGRSLTLAEVSEHFSQTGVAPQKTPEHLAVWTKDFPRTSTEKVKKNDVRAEILQGQCKIQSRERT